MEKDFHTKQPFNEEEIWATKVGGEEFHSEIELERCQLISLGGGIHRLILSRLDREFVFFDVFLIFQRILESSGTILWWFMNLSNQKP
jgi:hypothetical protein